MAQPAIELLHQENVFPFPKGRRGRKPIKATRMAALMLVNPDMTQVDAAKLVGLSMPQANANKTVKSEPFRKAYIRLQSKLNSELPFELKQAHEMYMTAYNRADNSVDMIKAVDSLCKLHGIGGFSSMKQIPQITKPLEEMNDKELNTLIQS